MTLPGLKHYLPRGLYGRAALILVLPVVALQLVVSIVFIQRHFEDVTAQMTETVIRELELVLDRIETAADGPVALAGISGIAEALELDVSILEQEAVPPADTRLWYDVSGIVMISTLRESLPKAAPVLLADDRVVTVHHPVASGVLRVQFDRRRVSASVPHQLLVIMVTFGMLMTAIAFIYLRNQLRPIARLAEAAKAFGRGQTMPYSPRGATEVREAGRAFLDMRNRIERHIEQRTMMLSGVSHDLRTPLTRLKLGLSMMEGPEAADLQRDVDEMQTLLDAFLDFAKGASESAPELVEPGALVRQIVEDAQRAGTPVDMVASEGEGEVRLRPVAIRRAVENLIGNAVRYGNRAEVSVKLTERALLIRVEDDGPGIPPDQRAEAVKLFTRLDPSRNQNKGSGVGLGLAIATDIARAHGGVLRLGDSETLGGLRADIVIGR